MDSNIPPFRYTERSILIALVFASIANQHLLPYLFEGRTSLLEDIAILAEAQDNPWTNITTVQQRCVLNGGRIILSPAETNQID